MPGRAAIERRLPFSAGKSHRLDDAITDLAGAADDSWLIAGTASGRLVRYDGTGSTVIKRRANSCLPPIWR